MIQDALDVNIYSLIDESVGQRIKSGFDSVVTPDNPSLFPEKLMLIVSELSEALEEFRDGRPLAEVYYKPERPDKPEGVGVELADVAIRLFDLAASNGIDLPAMIELKQAYNRTRPHKHGRIL